MSDKPRTYSDSAVTLIIKGDNWPSVRGQIDDMNSLADELREASDNLRMKNEIIEAQRLELAERQIEIAKLKADLADEVGRP